MKKYFVFLLFTFFTGMALADSMEEKKKISRDYLIRKLENLYKTLESHHFARKPLLLRLAHVLSLRAEDRLVKPYDKTCKDCLTLGVKDARRSLSLYREIGFSIKGKHPVLYTHSLFQQAYLHRLMGEKSQSILYLKKIISISQKKEFLVRAYFNLGEIYFETYRYQQSLKAFNEVIKKGESPWAFRSHYHKIWSLYNTSSYNESIVTLENFLKSDLYKEGAQTEIEKALKQKLQKELVVLYSRSPITDQRIHFFYHFDKDEKQENTTEARNQRLFDLAKDLNRIGRAKSSNKVWRFYLAKSPSALNQIKAYTSMINNHFVIHSEGWLLKTGEIVEKLFDLQKQVSDCPKDICENLYKQQKRYLLELHRQAKRDKKLKPYLFSLYRIYNTFYPKEFDMLVKSAFLAKELKKYGLSQDLFQKSVQSLPEKIKQASDPKQIKNIKKDLEQVSVLQMEMAELSKERDRRYQAYDFYLKNGKDEKIMYQTKYQQAYLTYEDKKYQKASKLFKDLALLELIKPDKKIEDLALKSAHLALSSLNFLKDKDVFMAEWSDLFLKKFPGNKEFARIKHTAIFNLVKTLVSHQDFSTYPLRPSSDKKILKAWKILNTINISYLNKGEKIKYYMNKLLLAKEILKLKEMDKIISQLLEIKTLSKEDYKAVLTWKLWLAEIRFDFSETLRLVKILNSKKTTEEHYLRMAYLAELANKNYIPYYETYLEKYPTSGKSFDTVRRIIDKAPEKDKKYFLKKYISYFSKKPNILSYLVLKIDDQELNVSFMQAFASLPFMQDSSVNKFLERKFFIESFEKSHHKVQQFSLTSSASVKRLTQSIKDYKNLIDRFEKEAEQSVKIRDWLSQIVSFSSVHNELIRFYESILKLPLPKGLTSEEQIEYKKLMEDQMIPYKTRAVKLKREIDKLLAQNFMNEYIEIAKKEEAFHGILKWELEKLKPFIGNENQKIQLTHLLNFMKEFSQKKKTVVSLSEGKMEKEIYVYLKSKPFDKDYLNKLLNLEKSKKNETMSYYLTNRIERINKSRKGRARL